MSENYFRVAANVFSIETEALALVQKRLGKEFDQAISLILKSTGRVIICGMGKSGIIGNKISATLASTGTQSYSMHPAEAYHGDLGMVDSDDVFIAISYSGETDEVLKLLPFLKNNRNKIIAITGNKESTLATSAHCHLDVKVHKEACPLQLAPTSSTTATLVMGDAIAVALMEAKNFQPENFAAFHPGGSLGRRLLSKVGDQMITTNLPVVNPETEAKEVLSVVTRGESGIAVVISDGVVAGIITDGDVRRAIDRSQSKFFNLIASQMMTTDPAIVGVSVSMVDAIEIMDNKHIQLLLVCEDKRLIGLVKK